MVKDDLIPYRRLWAAVFQRGIMDYCSARSGKNYQKTSVYHWFWDDHTYRPGKFLWLCQLFDIDPHQARSRILNDWRRYVDRHAPMEEL